MAVTTLNPPFSLPPQLIGAWEAAVLAEARLPRGTSRKASPASLVDLVLRTEQRGVLELWEIFTQERRELRRHLLAHKRDAMAYLLGFHLPNAARLTLAIDRLGRRAPLTSLMTAIGGRWRWHDLGCGTGALAHAGLTYLQRTGFDRSRLELHLADVSGVLLDLARSVLSQALGAATLKTHKLALEQLPVERYAHQSTTGGSIYSLGYVWNELAKNKAARARLMRIWEGHVERNEPALVFLLEPATQDMSRAAMQWRDAMATLGWQPLYPCPAATPCPMLLRSRDWCYSEASWRRPRSVTQLDQYLELDRSQLSATIFVMASPTLIERALPNRSPPPAVIVGRPQRTDAFGFDYLLCNGDELSKQAPLRHAPLSLRGETAPTPTTPTTTTAAATKKSPPGKTTSSKTISSKTTNSKTTNSKTVSSKATTANKATPSRTQPSRAAPRQRAPERPSPPSSSRSKRPARRPGRTR